MASASKIAIALLCVALVVSLGLNALYMQALGQLSGIVEQLEKENRHLREVVMHLNATLQRMQSPPTVAPSPPEGWKWIYAVAVYVDRSGEPHGIVLKMHGSITPGEGRIFVATTPKIGIELQESAETAFHVACSLLGINESQYDFHLVVEAPMSVNVVDGPSAGSAITVLAVATLLDAEINHTIVSTGTINPDGTIGKVGGVYYKALASAEAGAKTFTVPRGQSIVVVAIPKTYHPAPWVTITTYTFKEVNLQEYLQEKGYSLKVAEVKNIQDLLAIYGIKLPG